MAKRRDAAGGGPGGPPAAGDAGATSRGGPGPGCGAVRRGGVPGRRRSPQMGGQRLKEGLVEMSVDQLEQGPDRPLRKPRIGAGRNPDGGRGRGVDQGSGKWKGDVGADPVPSTSAGAEAMGEPLGQPALHTAGRYGHDLGRHRIRKGLGQDVAEDLDQSVRPLRAVYVQHLSAFSHALRLRRGCDGGVTHRLLDRHRAGARGPVVQLHVRGSPT